MTQRKNQSHILKRLLPLLAGQKAALLLSLLFTLCSVALTLYIPILIGRAIDQIVGPGYVDLDSILTYAVRIVLLAAAAALTQWIAANFNNRLSFGTVRRLRDLAFSKLQRLPLAYLDSHPHGELVSRIIADADQLGDGLLLGFTQLFSGVLTILGTLLFMLSIHPITTAVVVCLTPLSLLSARFIARHTYAMFKKQSQTRGEQTALIGEMIDGQKVVQAFSHEAASLAAFDEINGRLTQHSLKATFYSSITNPTTRFINSLVYAGVGISGALAAIRGTMTVGSLSCFLSYANQYTKPFNEISGVVTELQNSFACAQRIFELLDEPEQTPEADAVLTDGRALGEVSLEKVSFSYNPQKPLIRDLTLAVKPGQRVALVGPTGCGKTTLINLLMRFYEVNSGHIFIDGQNIQKVTRRSLRKNFGMVLQETWLHTGTVRDNLKMGKPDATDEEMLQAAKLAHAHGFITRLPMGYDTVLGEDGGSLSEGQRQLLCIARVMLCSPPMLILDEATSSIDTRTELKVQDAFSRLMTGRTCFVVAHRLSTIRDADIILVMKDGQIIERGTHTSLLATHGFYSTLYNSQFAQ